MITVYRNSVQSWEIDQMGHMNVQFYFEKALQGCVVLWNKLGINKQPVELGNTDLSLTRAHIRFLKGTKARLSFFFESGNSETRRYRSKAIFGNDRNDHTATLCCFQLPIFMD